jgi:hypothetical protein
MMNEGTFRMEAKATHHIPASPGISQMSRQISSFPYETCTFREFYIFCNCLFDLQETHDRSVMFR